MAVQRKKKQAFQQPKVGVVLIDVIGINMSKEDYVKEGGRANKDFEFTGKRGCDAMVEDGFYTVNTWKKDQFIRFFETQFGRKPNLTKDYECVDKVEANAVLAKIAIRTGGHVSLIRAEWFSEDNVVNLKIYDKGEEKKMHKSGYMKSVIGDKVKVWNPESKDDPKAPKHLLESEGFNELVYGEILDLETRKHHKGGTLGFSGFVKLFSTLTRSNEFYTEDDVKYGTDEADMVALLGGFDELKNGDFSTIESLILDVQEESDVELRSIYAVAGKAFNFKTGKNFNTIAPIFRAIQINENNEVLPAKITNENVIKAANPLGIFTVSPLSITPVEVSVEVMQSLTTQYDKWKAILKAKHDSFANKNSAPADSNDAKGDQTFGDGPTDTQAF